MKNIRLPNLPFVRHLLGIQLLFWFIICNNFITDLNWGRNFPYHELTRIASMLLLSLLIFALPRAINSWPQLSLSKTIERIFPLAGAALFLHYLVTGIIYFSSDYAKGLMYFDGHRVLPAFFTFIMLALNHSYFVVCILSLKVREGVNPETRKYMRLFAFGSIVAIPLMLVIDNLRWLFPILWNPLPEERVLVTPAFYVFFNYCFVKMQSGWSALRTTTGKSPEELLRGMGLSKREAEVANLLVDGMAYKEIATKLFISLSTVQSHVKQVYRKTSTSSKMQLRDLLTDSGDSTAAEILEN